MASVVNLVVVRLIVPAECLAEIARMLLAEPVKPEATAHVGTKH